MKRIILHTGAKTFTIDNRHLVFTDAGASNLFRFRQSTHQRTPLVQNSSQRQSIWGPWWRNC